METTDEPIKKNKKQSPTTPIRVKKSTARSVKALLTKLNRKNYGRKVVTEDIISLAISKLDNVDFEQIQESTYSSSDRLEIQFKKYCQEHGQVSKEQFLDALMRAGLPELSNIKNQHES